jgi:N-acylneuraminate-9-phosphatase
MLKALFLDLDETLCDTKFANDQAKKLMADTVQTQYRHWDDDQRERYMTIIQQQSEKAFRVQLIQDLLAELNLVASETDAMAIQDAFDIDRINAFDFYEGIVEFLHQARKKFTLVVITNGPEFSQTPKIERVNLASHVDHIIIGGQEPDPKPAKSIFDKALKLANCEAHEVIHVGDSLAADIKGAHNSGITSVWIQHQQPLDAELGINPDHTLFHPSEIPVLVDQLQQGSGFCTP